jgi:hypothetical protein
MLLRKGLLASIKNVLPRHWEHRLSITTIKVLLRGEMVLKRIVVLNFILRVSLMVQVPSLRYVIVFVVCDFLGFTVVTVIVLGLRFSD